jgi:hypothetical protein
LLNTDELENMKRGFEAIFVSALDRKSLLPLTCRVGEMLEAVSDPQAVSGGRDAEVVNPVHALR